VNPHERSLNILESKGGNLDEKDWVILEALQENARIGFAELGRRVGLSAPTVAERMNRLQDEGTITGYHATVDPSNLGLGLPVFIRITVSNRDYSKFKEFVNRTVEILECYHVTGAESFMLKVRVASVQALEDLIGRLNPYGQTATSLVLSTCLERRTFRKPVRS
jgi:Lrp/AsnC family transcriptional regulator, leucine-responsive regulatory protein